MLDKCFSYSLKPSSLQRKNSPWKVLSCPGLTGLSLLPGWTLPSPFHLPKELATAGHVLRAPQVAASYCTYAPSTTYNVPQVGDL